MHCAVRRREAGVKRPLLQPCSSTPSHAHPMALSGPFHGPDPAEIPVCLGAEDAPPPPRRAMQVAQILVIILGRNGLKARCRFWILTGIGATCIARLDRGECWSPSVCGPHREVRYMNAADYATEAGTMLGHLHFGGQARGGRRAGAVERAVGARTVSRARARAVGHCERSGRGAAGARGPTSSTKRPCVALRCQRWGAPLRRAHGGRRVERSDGTHARTRATHYARRHARAHAPSTHARTHARLRCAACARGVVAPRPSRQAPAGPLLGPMSFSDAKAYTTYVEAPARRGPGSVEGTTERRRRVRAGRRRECHDELSARPGDEGSGLGQKAERTAWIPNRPHMGVAGARIHGAARPRRVRRRRRGRLRRPRRASLVGRPSGEGRGGLALVASALRRAFPSCAVAWSRPSCSASRDGR